jgi:nucleotide-binding universal stress UspA family protein
MAGDLRVVAWVEEHGWEAVVEALAGLRASEVTVVHVMRDDIVEAPASALAGILGRHRGGTALEERLSGLSREAGGELLAAAAARLEGVPSVARELRAGRPEHEVLAATAGADLLVLARDSLHPGPHSLGRTTRFVVDHAPCRVLLVWPGEPAPRH